MSGSRLVDRERLRPARGASNADTSRSNPSRVGLVITWTLVVVSVLSWRTEAYYSGGLDAVVVAKALLSVVALARANSAWARATHRSSIGVRSLLVIGAYLTVTVLGGWASSALVSSGVLAVRVAILAATVALLVSAYRHLEVLRTLCVALVLVGLFTAATGASSLAYGRLSGEVLPISPNQLAMMFGFPLIVLTWGMVHGQRFRFDLLVSPLLLGLIWLTGSRTGLAAVVLGLGLVLLSARRVPTAALVGVVAAAPLAVYFLSATGFVAGYFGRGGTSNLSTLSSRTIAWRAAFDAPFEFWSTIFGRGLSAKTVGVSGTYWDTQVLDSSWVSAYVQGGIIGISLLAVWALLTLAATAGLPPQTRSLWLPLAAFALLWSTTASGLVDAYVLFVIMFLAAVCSEPASRAAPDDLTAIGGDLSPAQTSIQAPAQAPTQQPGHSPARQLA